MANVSDWANYVVPELPECNEDLIERMVLESVITFCRRSQLWVEDLAPQPIVTKTAGYELSPPTGADIAAIQSVRYNGNPLAPTTQQELDTYRAGWRDSKGTPVAFIAADNRTILLDKTPEKTELRALQVTVALQPRRDAVEFPDVFLREWLQAIASGAKFMLMRIPNKPWSAPEMAVFYAGEFERAIADATFKSRVGFGYQNRRLRGPRISR